MPKKNTTSQKGSKTTVPKKENKKKSADTGTNPSQKMSDDEKAVKRTEKTARNKARTAARDKKYNV